MAVFVMNLKRNRDRREYIAARLGEKASHLNFYVVDDSEKQPATEILQRCQAALADQRKMSTKGEIDCYTTITYCGKTSSTKNKKAANEVNKIVNSQKS